VPKKIGIILFLSLIAAVAAEAQVTVRGQIYLPSGDLPRNPIRYYVTSPDGRLNEYRFTDSNGRFIIERVAAGIELTITIDGDGVNYATTIRQLIPQYESTPRIILRPIEIKGPTGPKAEAAEQYAAALKDLEKKDFDSAEKRLRKAIEIDPQLLPAKVDLSALLMQKRNYTEAETLLRKVLEAEPKPILALLNLGITLNHLGKYTEAIETLREALRLQPGLVTAHVHLGIALVETDQFEEAESELLRGAKAGGDDEIPAQLYLGKLYARTGKYDKAIAAFETYLQKAPNAANADEVRELIKKLRQQLPAKP
jgi:tetratricopeptide (TPR) repeat protein